MYVQLLEETKVGRNINRHYYSLEEIETEVERPVVKSLLKLMEFRNTHPAFDGSFELVKSGENELHIVRENGEHKASLRANFKDKTFVIEYTNEGSVEQLSI